jgi:hypothetical protein
MRSRGMRRGRTAVVLGALLAVVITASAGAIVTGGEGPHAPLVITVANSSLVKGTGETGSFVTVENEDADEICSRKVTAGSWQCAPAAPLAPGSTITATMEDKEGNPQGSATAVIASEPGGGGGSGGGGGGSTEPFSPNFDDTYGAQYVPVDASGKPVGAVDPDTQTDPEPDPDALVLGVAPNPPPPTTGGGTTGPGAPKLAPVRVPASQSPTRRLATPTARPAISDAIVEPAIRASAVPGNGAIFTDASAEPAISVEPAELPKAPAIVTDHVEITADYDAAITGGITDSLVGVADLAALKNAYTGEVFTVTTLGALLDATIPSWAKQEIADSMTLGFPITSIETRDYSADQLATELSDPIEFNRDALNVADAALGNSSLAGGVSARGIGCNGDWHPGTISKSKSLDWTKQYKFDKSGSVGAMQWAMKAYIYGALHGSVGADIAYETKKCFGIPYAIRFVKATLKAHADGHLQGFLQAKAQIEYEKDFSYTLPYQFGGGFEVLGFKFEASAQADITGGVKISAAVDAEIKMRLDAIGIIDYEWECPKGEGCHPVKQDWSGNVTKSDDTGARLNIDLGISPYIEIGIQAVVAIIAPILSGRVAVVVAAPVHLYAAACLYDIDNDNNFDGSYGLFIDVTLDLYGYYYYQAFSLKGWGTFPLGGPTTNPNDVSGGWRRVTTDADSSSMYHVWPGHESPMVSGVKLTKTTKVLFSRPLVKASPGVLRPVVRQKTGGISIKRQTCYPFNSGKPKYQIDFDGLAGPRAPEATLFDEGVVPFVAGTTPTGPGKVAVRIVGDDMGRNFDTVRYPSKWVEITVVDPATLPPDAPAQIEPDVQITKGAKQMKVDVKLDGTPGTQGQPAALVARVTVTNPNGQPIKGATVNGTWKKATGSGFTTTNASGVAEFTAQSYPLFNPANEATTFTVDVVEADGFGKLSGNLTATWVDITRWNAGAVPGQSLVSTVLKKTPVPMAVSLGDSYMSGEGGRWAGNATDFTWWDNTDRGKQAYSDRFGGGEMIALCHRSMSAPIHFQASRMFSMNLACSGAETKSAKYTALGEVNGKPGVDFGIEGVVGQLTMLQELTSRYEIGVIELSIGGNDFGFGKIVQECLISECRNSAVAQEAFTRKDEIKGRIVMAINGIKTAMAAQTMPYNVVVHNYPSPIAKGDKIRWAPTKSDRQLLYGCGFSKADATWANDTLLPSINQTVADAVTQARGAGSANVYLLDISGAFAGHRLCETSAKLVGEYKWGHGFVKGTDRDLVEWATQIRTVTAVTDRFMLQEGLHPNYWGQLALRSCARQMYGFLKVASPSNSTMHCRPGGLDILAVGNEPSMTLSPV